MFVILHVHISIQNICTHSTLCSQHYVYYVAYAIYTLPMQYIFMSAQNKDCGYGAFYKIAPSEDSVTEKKKKKDPIRRRPSEDALNPWLTTELQTGLSYKKDVFRICSQ